MPETFMKSKLKSWSGTKLTTIDTYVVVPDAITGLAYFLVRGYKTKTLQLSAATNALIYAIDVSVDGSVWVNKVTEQALAVATPVVITYTTEIWEYLRVQVKPAAAGQHGTITVKMIGGTL